MVMIEMMIYLQLHPTGAASAEHVTPGDRFW